PLPPGYASRRESESASPRSTPASRPQSRTSVPRPALSTVRPTATRAARSPTSVPAPLSALHLQRFLRAFAPASLLHETPPDPLAQSNFSFLRTHQAHDAIQQSRFSRAQWPKQNGDPGRNLHGKIQNKRRGVLVPARRADFCDQCIRLQLTGHSFHTRRFIPY